MRRAEPHARRIAIRDMLPRARVAARVRSERGHRGLRAARGRGGSAGAEERAHGADDKRAARQPRGAAAREKHLLAE